MRVARFGKGRIVCRKGERGRIDTQGLRALLVSLDEPAESAKEVERAWAEEVERRIRDVKERRVKLIPAEQVFREARARSKRVQRSR